jgi:putative ABC transport system permease protein
MEVALAVMLVIGAGLLIRSFGNLQAFDPGFNAGGVLTLMLDMPRGTYPDDATVAQFYRRLEERLRALPDVQAASLTSTLPLEESVDYYSSFTLPDREPPPPGEVNQAYFRQVGHDFFRVMGVQLLAGRGFTEQDREDAPGVVVINETLAQQYWPDEDPVGERISGTAQRFGPLGVMLKDEVEIVGVVEDVRYVGLRDSPQPSLYFPVQQAPFRRMTVVLRTDRDPSALTGSVRAAVAELDAELPISRIATMEHVLDRSVAQDRFSMLLLLLFGASALVLAAIGIYGVLSYNVEQRTRELGIRMALGAAAGEVRTLVLRQATLMIGVGIVVGLAAAFLLSRVLESQLFGVSSHDPLTFGGVAVLLAAIAFAASYLPARRATSVDPIVALRNE